MARWKNLLRSMLYFVLARGAPGVFARGLRQKTHAALGAEYDVGKHFTPRYKPWDERLCIIPDGDLFTAIREQRASVVTDEIASFTATGIQLKSGEHLAADVIVSATGLALKLVGGMALVVDGKPVEMPNTMAYKGLMYSGVPNLASAFGYTNASWTLKCDLIAEHVCRLLNFMKAHDYVQCMPVRDPSVGEEPVLNFTSGYVQRALPSLPTQGTRAPWRVHQNYVLDLLAFRHGRVDNPSLQFKRRT
jgi:cation diffusion facilitator CzcD-associated flavoprotein CzcO